MKTTKEQEALLPLDEVDDCVVSADVERISTSVRDAKAARSDARYQARKAEVARLVLDSAPDYPELEYLEDEQEVWRMVYSALRTLHPDRACAEFNEGAGRLRVARDEVPRLREVSDRLTQLSGFALKPAPGILPPEDFYSVLARRVFCSALYVRSPATPYFTDDPDVIHELLGHACSLANPRIAALYELAGQTFSRLSHPTAVARFSRIFWFIFETAVIEERPGRRAFGAALLSSAAELTGLDEADSIPYATPMQMVTQPYSISSFQDVVFCFECFDHLEEACDDLFNSTRGDSDFLRMAPLSIG